MSIRIAENIGGNISVVYKAWFIQRLVLVKVLVEEAIAAYRVAHVHIHNTPRSQYRLLVRIPEV